MKTAKLSQLFFYLAVSATGYDLSSSKAYDLQISNTIVESAALEKYNGGIKIIMKLTEYAKHYALQEKEVLAPQKPPTEFLIEGDIINSAIAYYKYSVDLQCFNKELRIIFSAGEYEIKMSDKTMTEVENEIYSHIVSYQLYQDIELWTSAWDKIEAAEIFVDLISEDSVYAHLERF